MTRLLELIDKYWQGTCPVFAPGAFLSFENMRARCVQFDRVLKNVEDMAEAALLNLYLGFEACHLHFSQSDGFVPYGASDLNLLKVFKKTGLIAVNSDLIIFQ